MEPTNFLPALSLLSLVSVEYGGFALLTFITKRNGTLGAFRERFFRVGHAHAGVLLVLSLVYYAYLDRTGLGNGARWFFGGLLFAGGLTQSAGFFLHMAFGREGAGSIGTKMSRLGAIALAVPLAVLAIELLRL